MGKKIKYEKIKKERKFKLSNVFFFFLSLALTAFVFMGLVMAENHFSKKTIYVQVVTAIKSVPQNEIITEKNVSEYFALTDIDSVCKVENSLENTKSLIGKRTLVPFTKGEIVLEKDFDEPNKLIEDLENPVIVSVEVASLSDIAGGIIREGDLVNISVAYDSLLSDSFKQPDGVPFPYTPTFVLENVYVSGAMNANGEKISSSDTKSSATVLLLTVEKETEIVLGNALINGNMLRISKVIE